MNTRAQGNINHEVGKYLYLAMFNLKNCNTQEESKQKVTSSANYVRMLEHYSKTESKRKYYFCENKNFVLIKIFLVKINKRQNENKKQNILGQNF
jgi:hypothetical protein